MSIWLTRYWRNDADGSMIIDNNGKRWNAPYVEITPEEYEHHLDSQMTQERRSARINPKTGKPMRTSGPFKSPHRA